MFKYGLAAATLNETVLASTEHFSGMKEESICMAHGCAAADFGQDRTFYVYSATTAELPASTRFYYVVGDMTGAGWSAQYSFLSLPGLGAPVRYAVYADFGFNNSQSLSDLLNETAEGVLLCPLLFIIIIILLISHRPLRRYLACWRHCV